jgi:hypothetical protein
MAQAHALTGEPRPLASGKREAHARAWRVLHACDEVPRLLPVLETQLTAGMKPSLVTLDGSGPAEIYLRRAPRPPAPSISLLHAWNDVRQWRKSILEADPAQSADLVHAHCFAAGMAAVRNCPSVVYELCGFEEEQRPPEAWKRHWQRPARPVGPEEAAAPGAWMARSFRAAEQFVLARAGAVIVPSATACDGAMERGARREDVFIIPPPLELCPAPPSLEDGHVRLFAPEAFLAGNTLPAAAAMLFELFAAVIAEVQGAVLVMVGELESSAASQFFSAARKLGLENRVVFLPAEEMPRAFALAEVVIAGLDEVSDRSAAEVAMANARAVLAADSPAHRELTSDGRGCLWFASGDRADLVRRAVFLVQDAAFRAALGRAGYEHLRATRTGKSVARAYDAAYRHAFARRRPGGPHLTFGGLQPLHACF